MAKGNKTSTRNGKYELKDSILLLSYDMKDKHSRDRNMFG